MFLDIVKSIILGVVEGITEFLPISSTGHLILVNEWLSFKPSFTVMFDVVVQLGAILAVIIIFWKKLWPFGKDRVERPKIFNLWHKTITGVVPALVLGALFGGFIEEKLFNPLVVAVALVLGGIILILVEKRQAAASPILSVKDISYPTAFYIGLCQSLAMIPGTSRAAATIIGAMLLGVSRSAAVEFSFFLAIPTMLAASVYSLWKHGITMTGNEFIILTVGFIAAFLTAWAVIKFFLRYIQTHDFKIFGYYRIALGLLILLLFVVV